MNPSAQRKEEGMWGDGGVSKKLKTLSTAELGAYPRSNRETKQGVLSRIESELSQREHDSDWAEAELALGRWYQDLGLTSDAKRCYESALRDYYEPQKDHRGVGNANFELSRAWFRSSEPDYYMGEEHLLYARAAFVRAELEEAAAWCDRELAQLFIQQARTDVEEYDPAKARDLYKQALGLCEQALPVLRAGAKPRRLADCLLSRAIASWKLGDRAKADSDCLEATNIFRSLGDDSSLMLCDQYRKLIATPPW